MPIETFASVAQQPHAAIWITINCTRLTVIEDLRSEIVRRASGVQPLMRDVRRHMNVPPASMSATLVDLRRAQPDDAASLYSLAADAEVMHFMDWAMPTGTSSTKAHLEEVHASWDAGREYQWIVLERESGACAGTISVRVKGHAADFGYFFGRRFWGRGLAFDAASAVLLWLDTQPQILRVWATVDSENVRSRRLLERLGLCLEGTMRRATLRPNIGGPPRDTVMYARLKHDQ